MKVSSGPGQWHGQLCGAVRHFDLDEDDIEPMVLARRQEGHSEVMEIVWVDTILGGSGILNEMILNFPAIAHAAVQHLSGHDCPSSCYRCLRSYRNQRIYRLLNWRIIMPQLLAASTEMVSRGGTTRPSQSTTEGSEWDTARREGCGSPQELYLLLAMRQFGLSEPQKQFRITGDQIPITGRLRLPTGILIYAMVLHSIHHQNACPRCDADEPAPEHGLPSPPFCRPQVTRSAPLELRFKRSGSAYEE
jgi:hypothetical protein